MSRPVHRSAAPKKIKIDMAKPAADNPTDIFQLSNFRSPSPPTRRLKPGLLGTKRTATVGEPSVRSQAARVIAVSRLYFEPSANAKTYSILGVTLKM
jgi:hypothetical protein